MTLQYPRTKPVPNIRVAGKSAAGQEAGHAAIADILTARFGAILIGGFACQLAEGQSGQVDGN